MIKSAIAMLALCAAAPAMAQTTSCTYGGGTMTCNTTDPHQYDYLRNAGKDGAEQAGRITGGMINGATQPPPKVAIVWVTRHEGKITEIKVCYTSGKCADPLTIPADISDSDYTKLTAMLNGQPVYYLDI
jgi:hypothetical protein